MECSVAGSGHVGCANVPGDTHTHTIPSWNECASTPRGGSKSLLGEETGREEMTDGGRHDRWTDVMGH